MAGDPRPPRAAPGGRLVRVRATVAYDGAAFHGFAANPGVQTVQATLADALARTLGHPVTVTGAGRTDAGVHASGQVVSFDVDEDRFDALRLRSAVNGLCGPALVCLDVARAAPDFDARFSARWRRYRYTVLNRPVPDPFLARTSWWVTKPLDLALLRLAADPLLGEHDFTSFCRRRRGVPDAEQPSLVRRVLDAGWSGGDDGLLTFEIRANAFCHNQVRAIVGTLVEVGRGRLRPGDVGEILRARDRSLAGRVAPPHGLCLVEVGY